MTAVARSVTPQSTVALGGDYEAHYAGWDTNLKVVESAKDKIEGLKARAKGKRGGDASKGNMHTYSFTTGECSTAPSSPSRKGYAFKPADRNPIINGDMVEHRPMAKRVPVSPKRAPPTCHKVVNNEARRGSLAKDAPPTATSYSILVGDGPAPKEVSCSKRSLRNHSEETTPAPQRPTGRGGVQYRPTDPWRAELAPAPDMSAARHRCVPNAVRRTHTFEEPPVTSPYSGYKVQPPYGVDQ